MENLLICGDKHKINEIYIILINEQKQSEDNSLYFISLFSKTGRFDYFSFNRFEFAQMQLRHLNSFLKVNCVYDFANIDNSFLVNMNNTQHVKLYGSPENEFIVRATFKNNGKLDLYRGFTYKTAEKYTKTYNKQLSKYECLNAFEV